MKPTPKITGYQLGNVDFQNCRHQWRDHHDPNGEFKFCDKCHIILTEDNWQKILKMKT